jgi:hypothetical protein
MLGRDLSLDEILEVAADVGTHVGEVVVDVVEAACLLSSVIDRGGRTVVLFCAPLP